MQLCSRGIVMSNCPSVCPSVCLSVRPSVSPSNAWIVTKRKHLAKKVQLWLLGSFPMSLRWTAYVAPNPQRGPQKRKIFHFPYKNGLFWKKVCYIVSLCENFQWQHYRAFTGLSKRTQMVGGTSPSTWNFRRKLPTPFKNGDFQSIFSHSAWTIASSEKSSIITNRKSTMGFPMSLRWTAYVAPKLPKERLKNAKWPFVV